MVFSLGACGVSAEDIDTDDGYASGSTQATADNMSDGTVDSDFLNNTPISTEDTSKDISEETSEDMSENVSPEKDSTVAASTREFSRKATIEETVLVDENNVKITATELTYGNYAFELALVIENNSDKDLSFIANSVGYSCNSVNGYMISDGYLNCDVAAGKKANDRIMIDYDTCLLYTSPSPRD